MFLVEPGVSFHSVREVRGDRARVSLQGWLHAPSMEQTLNFENRKLATLQQLICTDSQGDEKKDQASGSDKEEQSVSDEDFKVLSKWLSPAYLSMSALEAVSKQFEDDSYALLTEFLRPDLAEAISKSLQEVDAADGFAPGAEESPIPLYEVGTKDGWELIGPPHLRRYLRHVGDAKAQHSTSSSHSRLGGVLGELAKEMFSSDSFRRWLEACSGLRPKDSGSPEVRRFRPGMDYVVAAKEASSFLEGAEEIAHLDATLVFAFGEAAAGSSRSSSSSSSDAQGDAAALRREASERWSSEEVGGFESYLAADEDEETAEAQEVYRGADADGPLVNLPATPNALSLIMRDSKTLRFVKYLSRDAPSSRVDLAASYEVDAPAGSEEENE
eukprot:TRINITY_DN39302_c0_g1_i1.p1 TRINITY_DN39302_c0_g1~~TRINITY_DN39302_c0_g1_i1.p1  ORF type:complete len:440 (-),score=110.43 TRINITY_DN39302_c0_g1_i1:139-1296(-)